MKVEPEFVPVKNSTDNIFPRDVIGNKLDTLGGDSLYSKVGLIVGSLNAVSETYPFLADPVTLTASAGVWSALPTPTEIVPVDTITTNPFKINWIVASTMSAAGDYIIQLYQGLAGFEIPIANSPVSKELAQSQQSSLAITTPLLAIGTRISAALSSGNAAANTLEIKIKYNYITPEA